MIELAKFVRHRAGEYSATVSARGLRVRAVVSRVLYNRWSFAVYVYPDPRLPFVRVARSGYSETMAAAVRACEREARELARIVEARKAAA